MRKVFFSLILMWVSLGGGVKVAGSEIFQDLRSIRKLYLDVIGVPPTPSEVEWLCVYETNSYESAVNHVLNKKYGNEFTLEKEKKKKELLEISYRKYRYVLLPEWQTDLIIKYQAGCIFLSLQEAKDVLIQNSLFMGEGGQDPIDYLFMCLCGRPTNANEMNCFYKIFKNAKDDKEGLSKVLESILLCHSFMFK